MKVMFYIALGFNAPIILFILFLLVQFIVRYIKYHNKSKIDEALVKDNGGEEIPHCPPALVSYYTNNKKLFLKGRIATAIDLISRGYITIKKSKDDYNNYTLIASKKERGELHNYELLILHLLEKEMDTSTFLKYIKGKRGYKKELIEFENMVSNQEEARFSYNNSKLISIERNIGEFTKLLSAIPACIPVMLKYDVLGWIAGGVVILLEVIIAMSNSNIIASVVLFIIVTYILFIVFKVILNLLLDINEYYSTFNVSKEEEYKNWINFKRILKKNDKEYNKNESESFYGYAIVFGCDKKFFYSAIKNKKDISILEYFNFLSRKTPNKRVFYRTLYKEVENEE